MKLRVCLLASILVVLAAAPSWASTIYTSDPNLADFTGTVAQYATFSNFSGGDVTSPYLPTSAGLAANAFRVFGGGSITGLPTTNNWILASFPGAVSQILVFPNINHFGSFYDGFQYSIEGSNDGSTWTPLFDALTVNGLVEPFTLGTFSGTAPSSVNNVQTGITGPGGAIGYEANFTFGTAYQFYAFGASTAAVNGLNSDQELSAVGAVPEPTTILLLAIGFPALLAVKRRRLA
jgi:hypothetical protein